MEDVHLNVTMTCCGKSLTRLYHPKRGFHSETTTMTKRFSEEVVDNLCLKATLRSRADGNELRRRRQVHEVLTKLDALDDRLASERQPTTII